MIDRLGEARRLDAADPLARLRDRFFRREGILYMDGNSLGLMSVDAEAAVRRALEQWRELAIDAWGEGEPPWFHTGERLGALTAPLVGAEPEAVVVGASTTVNLHNLVRTFYRIEANRSEGRHVIVADRLNFPSDQYALESIVAEHGFDPATTIRWVASRDGRTIDEADIEAALDHDVAIALFPGVYYNSGQRLDMARVARAAHAAGALAGFDLCHSAGVVPHSLDEWGADFAFWCTYKYLNGGPGSLAGLYVNRRHWGTPPAMAGWWGYQKDKQFDMSPRFVAAGNAGAWQIGSVSVFSAAPLEGSLAITGEAGIEAIREKSLRLTAFMMSLLDELPAEWGFSIGTPREAARRGGHVALVHPEAVRICAALKDRGVVPDYRPPDVVRLAPVPLYTSFEDVAGVVARLREVMESGAWRAYAGERGTIA